MPHAAFGCIEPLLERRKEQSLTSWASLKLGQVASEDEFTQSKEHFHRELFRDCLLPRHIPDLRPPAKHQEPTAALEWDLGIDERHVHGLLEVPDEPTERRLSRAEGGRDLLE